MAGLSALARLKPVAKVRIPSERRFPIGLGFTRKPKELWSRWDRGYLKPTFLFSLPATLERVGEGGPAAVDNLPRRGRGDSQRIKRN